MSESPSSQSSLWVVIPLANEVEVLPELHRRLFQTLDTLDLPTQVMFVDDGSQDASWSILCRFAAQDERIHAIRLSRNFGKEIALTAGLDAVAARDDVACAVVMDADLQDPPEVIVKLLDRWREGHDVVYATRARREGETAFKKLTAAAFYRVMEVLSDTPVPRDTGDFRLLSKRALQALSGLRERRRFMKGLFAWIGYSQAQVCYVREPRAGGRTTWNYGKLWRLAVDGITAFSTVPLRFATWMGVLASLFAFSYGLWVIGKALWLGNSVPGYPSLMAVILFLGGVQLLALGVLGEYIGRIYTESKQRPMYLIAETARIAAHQPAESKPQQELEG